LSVLLHRRNPEGQYRLGVFFHVEADPGRREIPVNAEPHKCAGIGWYPMQALPDNTVRYTAAGVHLHRHGIPFAAAVWPAPTCSAISRERHPTGGVGRRVPRGPLPR
jgi:hypothetical protein